MIAPVVEASESSESSESSRTPPVVPASNAVVELRGIRREFGADPPVLALRDVNLTVRAGEWLSILGPSGSGKSTLLNVIGLLDRHDAGTYLLDGVDVSALGDLARAGLRGQRIGFVFQAFHLMPHRTVLDNVMLAELYIGRSRKGRRERAMNALERVGLADRAAFLPTRLSGGQRQRAAIARAVLAEPSLLLCDEPTGNLDSESAASILDLFGDLWQDGMTLVIISHDSSVAARAGRQARMVDGQLTDITAETTARDGSRASKIEQGREGAP